MTSSTSQQTGMTSVQAFAFPASFAQRRLWFLNQLSPGDASYNIAGAVEIEGDLDTDALKKAIQEIVRRHEALRTLFEDEQGECRQVIQPEMRLDMEFTDLRSLPETERMQRALALRLEKSGAPFDLQRGPLFRLAILRLEDQRYWMVVAMHHIISDGWSIGILVRELADLYSAFSRNLPSPLQELPIQYVDYAAWQFEHLSSDRLQAEIDYWKGRLEGAPSGLQIVTDHPRGKTPAIRGAVQKLRIEAELTRALKTFAQEHGATLYMVLLAAYQALLHRYSGQDEVLVGSPIAGRSRKETQLLIGFFVNTLVMRATFDPGITFRQLIRQVKETALGAYAHQELPFEKIVEELSPERNLGRTPFFQTMFALQNAPMPELRLGSARLRMLDVAPDTAKFETSFVLEESGDVLEGTLEYAIDLFEAATIARLIRHFIFLAESLVRNPDRPISQAPLVDEDERLRLAEGWRSNVPQDPFAGRKSLVDRIAEHAGGAEDKTALVTAGKQITYRQLEQRAAQIAVQLQAGGVQPGTRVAACVGDAAQASLTVLGILRAGSIAVPVDPEQPLSRIDFILKDAGAGWLVTESKLEDRLREIKLPLIVLDKSEEPVAGGAPRPESRTCNLDEPALLIYQSGPSGRPEGAVIPHRSLLPRVFPGNSVLPADVVAVWPQISFEENGMLELLRCLGAGASLVQLESDGTPRKWASALREQKATVLYARALELEPLAREFATTLKKVRLIVCVDRGAEVARLAESLKADIAERVYCAYGMNETCGWCALYPLTRQEGIAEFLAGGTKLELLDAELNPLPEGIVGEVCVGGEQIALGYQHQREHTGANFLTSEYSANRDLRFYRSGDMGWRRNDGTLRIEGRNDGRDWITGMRMEAAEVEAALKGFEGLRDVGVLVRKGSVTAFLATDQGKAPATDQVQGWLAERIPQWMLPRAVYEVENIPRRADGSVDRVKLRALAEKAENVAAPYAPPETEIERKLVKILEKTLGLERVGIHDDFFRIGGHSLLATQAVAQISHECGVELPLRRLFEAPTAAQLAQIVTELSNSQAQAEAIPQIKRIARVPVQQQTIANNE